MTDTPFLEKNLLRSVPGSACESLRGKLPSVDSAALHWMEIARDTRWMTWVGPEWAPVVRPEAAVIARPGCFSFSGLGGHLPVTLDLGQWPELAVITGLSGQARRDGAARIVLAGLMARLNEAGCAVDDCKVITGTHESGVMGPGKRIPLRIGHFDVDLYPDERSQALAPPAHAGAAMSASDLQAMDPWVLATRLVIGQRQIPRDRLLGLRVGDIVLGGLDGTARLEIVSCGNAVVFASGRITDEGRLIMNEELHDDFEDSLDDEDDFALDEEEDDEYGFDSDGEDADDRFDPDARTDGGPQVARASSGFDRDEDPRMGRSGTSTARTIARLPMDVRYEIDGPRLTVARASNLGEGDVLVLPVSAAKAIVRLRCQGRTIALGELVCIGEQLGVRITSNECPDV